MSDETPTPTPVEPDHPDTTKPWFARSSFSSAVLGTAGVVVAGLRSGWDTVPSELYLSTVGLWLTFLSFLRFSPSRR